MTSENGPVEDLTESLGTPSDPPKERGLRPQTSDPTGRHGVVVVTGASSGIGLAAAEEFARRGWTVVLLGRDPGRLETARSRVRAVARGNVDAYRCDFRSLADVRTVATTLRESYPTIAVLANNAGGAVPTRRSTVDGFEETIQSNHLAHFLLSQELRESLRGGRIINTSSVVHMQGRIDPSDLNGGTSYGMMRAYGMAKQANVLFTVEATKRWPDIVSVAFHPGVVRTRFGNEHPLYAFFYRWAPGLRTAERGARTLVWLATVDRDHITPGGYYVDEKLRRASPHATDPTLARDLWTASLAAVGLPVG